MLLLNSCGGGTPTPPPVTSQWGIYYSPGMPAAMSPLGDGSYYFDFPAQDGVHYIYRVTNPVSQTVTMTFSITGTGTIVPTQGDQPARVRLFLQQAGDTLTAGEETKRWWSADPNKVELTQGDFTLSATIDPAQWYDVFGHPGTDNPAAFSACLAQLAHIGFTFGGAFAGHGVYVQGGSSRFILRSFVAQ